MKISRKSKILAALVPFAFLFLLVGYEGIRVWWNRGFSTGHRTGVIRKLSEKGPPYCKYFSGEMMTQGQTATLQAEIWEFSVDDDSSNSPIVKELEAAEKSGKPVTVDYRQDRGSLFRCTPSEYFVTGVDK